MASKSGQNWNTKSKGNQRVGFATGGAVARRTKTYMQVRDTKQKEPAESKDKK